MALVNRTNFGTLGKESKEKLRNDNDIKIIVVGANSQTGIGKTTLAIQLCRYIDSDWNAEDKSFIDIWEYLQYAKECKQGSAILIDEIEHGGDSRRAMSSENVELSHGWAMLRARNIAHVATLPSISMLDKRMLELADYWVLVKRRGLAQPFKINVNNFNPSKLPQRKPLPGDEHIRFRDLPDDDPDKEYIDQIKDDLIDSGGQAKIPTKEHKRKLKKAETEAKREVRDAAIKELYDRSDMSMREIAELEWIDMSQGHVSKIINSE